MSVNATYEPSLETNVVGNDRFQAIPVPPPALYLKDAVEYYRGD